MLYGAKQCFLLKLLTAVMAAASLPAALCGGAADQQVFLKKEAEAYLEAYQARDYETCLNMMGGEIVRALGGKLRVLDHFRNTEEILERRHLKLASMSAEDPRPVFSYGEKYLFTVIPEKHIYTARDRSKYVLDSYLLAVSENNGHTWNFLEGSWRIAEHIKNHDLILYDRLQLPLRKIYPVDDPRMIMVEKGGAFITPPETQRYKQALRQRD